LVTSDARGKLGGPTASPPASGLEEPAFGKADHLAAGDDEMVEHTDPDGLEGTHELTGDQLVSGGYLSHSARVLMRQD